jgi:hypothetical protein
VSGTVYDPAGKVPLYNIIVYVPNAPLTPISEGASCDRCSTAVSGSPIATAITNESGQFVLEDVPVGADVPLVIQVGKWRRQITVPSVANCTNTPLTDTNMTRLPRNKSEGHIPKIALTTGNADALECLLRKIGIEDSEFTPQSGDGRVNLFNGEGGTNRYAQGLNGGAAFTSAPSWWSSFDNLRRYDIVIHSCEGTENPSNKTQGDRQALQQYADIGGRVFLSHWHNYWIEFGPAPFPTAATFDHQADMPIPFTTTVDTSFPKGMALANWLVNVGGSTTRGQLEIRAAQHTVNAVNASFVRRWIYSDAMPGASEETLQTPSVQYLTFNTPSTNVPVDPDGEPRECGRIVLTDIHVSNEGQGMTTDQSNPNLPFPSGCRTADLSPQEKALEFMLFDLSSCIQRDTDVPIPPPIVP